MALALHSSQLGLIVSTNFVWTFRERDFLGAKLYSLQYRRFVTVGIPQHVPSKLPLQDLQLLFE